MANYELFVLDNTGQRVGQIDGFTRLDLVIRFNDIGKFLLTLPAESEFSNLITWKGGIEVRRNGSHLITGLVRHFERNQDDSRNELMVGGPDENAFLSDRIVYPAPDGNFISQAHDSASGPLETVLKHFVTNNLGPGALPTRQILSIQVDLARGNYVERNGRFQNLLELLQETVLQSGTELGFQVRNRVFEVFLPSDKRGEVVFSLGLGTMLEFDYTLESAKANAVICGASGELTSRIVREVSWNQSVNQFGRIESFRDRRDTDQEDEIHQTLTEELVKNSERFSLQFRVAELEGLKAFDHWNIGDLVTVMIDGQRIEQAIREIHVKVDQKNGETIIPVVGTPGMGAVNFMSGLFERMRDIRRRVDHLEVIV
ncbi:Gp37-like protein [Ornatilinea apprima]|nr:siphovirus ReqiPepy6 Gp37-like family protein [Ornatilinea apprima]